MKVCFVTQAFVRYPGDAVGSFVYRLGEKIAEDGVDVTVVAPHAQGLADSEQIGSLTVERFHYAPQPYERLAYQGTMHRAVQGNLLNKVLLASFLVSFVAKTVRTVRRQKADIIHAHWWFPSGFVSAIASAITGVPLVVTCHGSDVGLMGKNPLVDAAARWVFGRATAVTTVSDYLLARVVESIPALTGRAVVIPMPVDQEFTRSTAAVRPPQAAPRTIIAVGRLSKQKGFHDLIAAASILAQRGVDFRLLLVGDGEEREALKSLASCLRVQDRVEFLGTHTAAELATLCRAADVAVLPSYEEGLGLTLIEAMFCGAPVVGTRSGGISDVIADGETGALVPPGDTKALAQALERVLTDPAYARRLARAGQAYVRRHYDPDASVNKTFSIYQQVLHGHA